MNGTTIHFWGGLKTIGGTIVSIEYGDSRVIFDFGIVYSPATQIFDGQLKQRDFALVRDYLKLGAIPPINGVYSAEALGSDSELQTAEASDINTAVLISHLHLDHIGAMGLLSAKLPIYMSEDSETLYKALHKIGEGVMGDKGRDYRVFKDGQSFRIGDIQVTPMDIDHDIPGACGFHIQTPDGSLVYTGDLRFHGHDPEKTYAFIVKAQQLGFDVLITEGTTLREPEELPDEAIFPDATIPEDLLTERRLADKLKQLARDTEGLVIFNGYHRNIKRLKNLIEAAALTGRLPVLEPETAYLVEAFYEGIDYLIFQSPERSKSLEEDSLPVWLRTILAKKKFLSAEEINQNPSRYLLQNSYENSLNLFDLKVEKGLYIHSNGVPLGPFDPAYDNLDRILSLLNLEKVSLLSGGHAMPAHLKYFVDEMDPAVLIPLHSFYPERLQPKVGKQLLPEYGVTYELKDHTIFEKRTGALSE